MLDTALACPRCDKTPLERVDDTLHCKACKVDFPSIDGIHWMFAEPQAALGEWRNRLQFALQKLGHEIAGLDHELGNKDLPQLAREGEFREDLYYRISEIAIRIPALREREGDALLLARVFLVKYSQQIGKHQHRFSKDALAAIEAYPWPGNVRELENRVKRSVIMAEHKQISASDLELGGAGTDDTRTFNLREIREQAERQAIVRAMSHVGGKISQASELLGVSRPTMYDLIKKYNLK